MNEHFGIGEESLMRFYNEDNALPHGAVWQLLFVIASVLLIQEAHSHDRVVCYYTNWSVYRPGTAKFNPQNINPYLCTHLIYAFGGFTKDNTMKPFDKYQDIEQGGYTKFTGLKSYNKQLKTMLAIGGWNEGSSRFSPLVASADRRQKFIKNILKFLRQNHFDGLDLDWEYPAYRDGGKPRDRDNYAQFVQELRSEFDRESSKTGRPRLLLTMAVPAGVEYIAKGYDIPKLNKYLDWFNILSYDYHSAYEPSVNHHSPLYSLEEESEYNYDTELNIDHTIKFYLEAGAEKGKLVLGIPTYGRSYTLINEDDTEIGAPSDGPGEQGDATREKGYLAYYEICQSIRDDPDWTVVQPNSKAMGPYAFRGNQWVGYDDEAIVRKKSEYVADNGLGGIMFWSIDNDDFRGSCSGKPYPLIEAAKQALFERLGLSDNEVTRPNKNRKPSRSRSRQGSSNRNKVVEDNLLDAPKKEIKRPRPSSRRKTTTAPVTTTTATTSRRRIVGHTTTPEPPTTPDPGSDFKCEDEGFFAHPRDCKKYFWCLDSGPSNLGIVAHQFTCPSGLYFNTAADSCDFTRNVLCKKTPKTTATTAVTTERTTSITTTTNSPRITAATSRNSFLRRTTTNVPIEEEEEDIEYEDEDDDENDAKNSNRASDPEEDPKVIKELIELIKKLGGIEELEKQLQIQEDGSMILKNGETQEISTTPSSISKSLYAKVLSRPNSFNSLRGRFGVSRSSVTSEEPIADVTNEEVVKSGRKSESKYTSVVRNSRPSPQNDGIDQLSEFEGFLKEKPKYVTITRTRPTLASVANNNNDESVIEIDESTQVERSDDDLDSLIEEKTTSRPITPSLSYVNIRRTRPTTSSTEKSETTESSEEIVSKLTTSIKTQSNAIITTTRVNRVPLTEPTEESVSIGTTRTPYKSISRTKGTTSAPVEEEITASTITLSNRYKTIERTRPTRFSKTEEKLALGNQNTSDEGEDANVTVQNLDTEYTTTTTTQKPIQTTTSRIYANIGRRTTTSTISTTTTIPSAASTETQTPEYIAPEYLIDTVNTSTVTPIHSISLTLPESTTPQSSDQFPKHKEFLTDTTAGSIPVTDMFLNTEEHDTTETYKATDDSTATTTTTIGDQVTQTISRYNYSGNIDSKVKLTNLNTKTQSSLNISGIRLSDVDIKSHQLTKNLTDTLTKDQSLTSTTETVDNIDTEFLGTISSPRPFGFPRRRTRPTSTKIPVTNHEITTTNTGYDKTETDQNKVSPFKSFNVATTKGKTVSRYSNNEPIVSNNNYVDSTNYGEQKLGPVEESLSYTTTHSLRLLKDSIPKTNIEPLDIGPPKPTYSWRSMVNRTFRPFKSTTSDPSVTQSSSNFNTPSVSRRRPFKIDDSNENNSNDINTAETRGGRLPNSYSDLDSRRNNTATVPLHNVRPTRPASIFATTQNKQNIRSRGRVTANKVLEESSNINTSSIKDETQGIINKDNRDIVEDNNQHNENFISIAKEPVSNRSITIEDNIQDIDSNEYNTNLHLKAIAFDKKNSSIITSSTSVLKIPTGVIDGNENIKPHLEDSITTTDSKNDITLKATDSSSLSNTKHNETRNSGLNIKPINAYNRSRNITSKENNSSTTTDSKNYITLKTTDASRLANTKHNETHSSVPNIRRIIASNRSKNISSEDSISSTTTDIKNEITIKTTDAFSLRNTKDIETRNSVPNITHTNVSNHSRNNTSGDRISSTNTDSKEDIPLKKTGASSLRNTKHYDTRTGVSNLKANVSNLNITQSALKLKDSVQNRLDVKNTSNANQIQNNGENSSLEKQDSSTLNPNENPIEDEDMTTITSNLNFSENEYATSVESKPEFKETNNDFNRQKNIGPVNDEILISTTTDSITTHENENISRSSKRKDEQDSYSVQAFDKSKNDRGENTESTGSPGTEDITPNSGQYQISDNITRSSLDIEKTASTTEEISKYKTGSNKSVKLEYNEHDFSNTLKTPTVELDKSELLNSTSGRNESNNTEISPSEATTAPPAMEEDDDIKFNPHSITNAHIGFEPGRYVVRKTIRKRPMKKQYEQNITSSANTSNLVNLSDTTSKQIENNDTKSLEEHNVNIQNNTGNNILQYGVNVNNTDYLSFSDNSEVNLNVRPQNNQLYGRSRGREQQNITSLGKVFENSSRSDNLTLIGANTSFIASQQLHTGSNDEQKEQFEVSSVETNPNQRENYGTERSKARSGIGIEIKNKHKVSESESERNGIGEIVVNTDSKKFQNNSSDSTKLLTKEGSILGVEPKNKETLSGIDIDINEQHKIQLSTDTQELQTNSSDSTIIETKGSRSKDIVSRAEVDDNEKFKIPLNIDTEKLKSNSSGNYVIESKEGFNKKDMKFESAAENEKLKNQLNIDTKELQNNSSESTIIGITEERISETEIKNKDIVSDIEANSKEIDDIQLNLDTNKLQKNVTHNSINGTEEESIPETEIKNQQVSEPGADLRKIVEIEVNSYNKKLNNNSSDSDINETKEKITQEAEIKKIDIVSEADSNKTIGIQLNVDSKNNSESDIKIVTKKLQNNSSDSIINETIGNMNSETEMRNKDIISESAAESNKIHEVQINLDINKLENNSTESHITGPIDDNDLHYNGDLETSRGKFSNTKIKGTTSVTHIRNQTAMELNNHTDTVKPFNKSQNTGTKETIQNTSNFSRNQKTDFHIRNSKEDSEESTNLRPLDEDHNQNLTAIKNSHSEKKYESTLLNRGPVRQNGEIHIKKISRNESIHETDSDYNDNLETSQGNFNNARYNGSTSRFHIRNETGIELKNHTDTVVLPNKSQSAGTKEIVQNTANFSRYQKTDSHINLDTDKLENNSSESHTSGSTDENIHETDSDNNDILEASHGKFRNTTTKGSTSRTHIGNQTDVELNNNTDTVISPNKSQSTSTKETFRNISHFSRNQNTDSHIKDSKNDSEYNSNISPTDEVLKPNLTEVKSKNFKGKYIDTISDSGPVRESSENLSKKTSEENFDYRNTITTNRFTPLTKSSLSFEETSIKQSELEDNKIANSSQNANAPERKLRPGYEDDLSSLLAADFLKYKGSNNSSRRRIIPSRRPIEIDRKSHMEDTNNVLSGESTSQTGFTQRRRISISGTRNTQLNNVTSDNKTIIGHNSGSNQTSETTNKSKGQILDKINTDKNFINHTKITINGEDENKTFRNQSDILNLTRMEKIISTDNQLEGRNETNQIPSRSKSEYGKFENKSKSVLDESNITVKTLADSDEEYDNNEENRKEDVEEFSTETFNRKNIINLEKSDISEKNVSERTRGRQRVSIKTSSVDDAVTISTDSLLERKLRPEIESDLSSLLAGDFLKYQHSRNHTSRRIIPNRKSIESNVTDKVQNDLKSKGSELTNGLRISEKNENGTQYKKQSVQNNTAINSSQDTSISGYNMNIKTKSINRISGSTETANRNLEGIQKNLTDVSNSSNINDIEIISEACKEHNNSQIDLSNCTFKEMQSLENESSIQLSQTNTNEFSSIQEKQLNGTDTAKNLSNLSEKSTTESSELNSLEEGGILNDVSNLNVTEGKQNASKTKLQTIHRQNNTKESEITEDNRPENFKISASNTSHRNELKRVSTYPNKNVSSTIEKNTFKETRGKQHVVTETEITKAEETSGDKFIERKLRPNIESDLSSLLAVDIKNSSSRRRIIPKTDKISLNVTKNTNFQINLNKDNVTTEIDNHSRIGTDLFSDFGLTDTADNINVTISKNTSQIGDNVIEVSDTRNQQQNNILKNKTSSQELYPIFYRNKIENASGLRYKSLYRGKNSNGSLEGILDNTDGNNSYSIKFNSTEIDGTINNLFTANENTTSIVNKTLLNQKRFGLKSPHLEDGSAAFFSLVAENRAPDKNASTIFLLNNTNSENSSEINSFFPFTNEYIDDTSTTNIPDIENVDSSTLTADLENYDNSISTLYENESSTVSSTLSTESIDYQTTTNPIISDVESKIIIRNKLKQETNESISQNLRKSEVNSKLNSKQPSLNYLKSNSSTESFKNDPEKSRVKFFRKASEITRPPDVVNNTVYPTTPNGLRSFNRVRTNNRISLNTSNTFSDKSSNITASLGNASNATVAGNALSESTNNIISEYDETSSEKKEPEIISGSRRKVLFRRPTEKSLSARGRQSLNLTQSALKKIESSNTESEDTAEDVTENSLNEVTTDAGELIINTDSNLPPKRTYSLNRTKSEGKLIQTNRYRGRLSNKTNTTAPHDVIENNSNEVTNDVGEIIISDDNDSNLPPKRTYSVLNRSQSEEKFKQSNGFRGRLSNKGDTLGLQDVIDNNSTVLKTDAGEIITSTVSDDSESNFPLKSTYSGLKRTKSERKLIQNNRYRGVLSNKTDLSGPKENNNIVVDEQSTIASITDDNDNESSSTGQSSSFISSKYGIKNSTNARPFSRFSDSKRRLTLKEETLNISSPPSSERNNFKISTEFPKYVSNNEISSTQNKTRFRYRNNTDLDESENTTTSNETEQKSGKETLNTTKSFARSRITSTRVPYKKITETKIDSNVSIDLDESENTTTSNETEQKPDKEALNTTKSFSRSRVTSSRVPYKRITKTKIDSNVSSSNDSSTSTYSKYNAISQNQSLQKNNTLEKNSTDEEQTDEILGNKNKILGNIATNSRTRFSERKTSFFRKPKLLSADREDKEVNKTDVERDILNTVNLKGNDSSSGKEYNRTKIIPEKAFRNGTLGSDTSDIVGNNEEGNELEKNGSRVKVIRKLKTKTQQTTTESNENLSNTEISEVISTVESILYDSTTSTIFEKDEYINTTENPDISEQTEYDILLDKFSEPGIINDVTELPNDVTELPTSGIYSETDYPYNSSGNDENIVKKEEPKAYVENYDIKDIKLTTNADTTRSPKQSKSFRFSTRIATTPRTTNESESDINARQNENENNSEAEDENSLRLSTKYELKHRSTTSRPNFLRKLSSSNNTTTEESINSTEKVNDERKKINHSNEDFNYEEEEGSRSFEVVTKYTTNNRGRESIVRPNLVRTRLPISYTTTEKSFAENRSTTSRKNFFRKPSQATKTQSVNSTDKGNNNSTKSIQSDEADDYKDEEEGITSNPSQVSIGRPSFGKTKATIISSPTDDIVAENQSSTSRPNFFRKKIFSSNQATKEQSDNSTENDYENTKKSIQSDEHEDYETEEEEEVKNYTINNRSRINNVRPNVAKTNFNLNSPSTIAKNQSATSRPNFFRKPILSSSQTTKVQSVNSTEENNSIRKGIQLDEDEDYEDEDESNTSAEVKKYTTINRSQISSGRPSFTKTNLPAISSSTEEIVTENHSKTSRPNFFRKPTVSSSQDTTEQSDNSTEKDNYSASKTIQSDKDEDYEEEKDGNSFEEARKYKTNNRNQVPLVRPNLVKTNFNSSSTEETVTQNKSATSRPNFFKRPIPLPRKPTQEQSVNSTDKEDEDYEDEVEGSIFAEAKNYTSINRTRVPIVRPSFVKTNFPANSSFTENRSTTSRPNFFRKPTLSSNQARTEQSVNSTEIGNDSTRKTIQSDDIEDYDEDEKVNISPEVKNYTSTNRSRVTIGRQSFVKTNFSVISSTTEKNVSEDRSTTSRPNFFKKPIISSSQSTKEQSVNSTEKENVKTSHQLDEYEDYEDDEEGSVSEVKNYTTNIHNRVPFVRPNLVKNNFISSSIEEIVAKNQSTTSRPNFFKRPIPSSSQSTHEKSINSTVKENDNTRKTIQSDEDDDYEEEDDSSSFPTVKKYTTTSRSRVPIIRPNFAKPKFPLISSTTEKSVVEKLNDDDYDEDDTYEDYDEDEIKQPVTPKGLARPSFTKKPNFKYTPSTTTKIIESSKIDYGDEETNTITRPTISKFKFSRPPSFKRTSISESVKEPFEPTSKENNLDQNEDTNRNQANITTISSNNDNSTNKNSSASLLKYARKPTTGFIPHSVKSADVSTSTELKESLTKQRFNFPTSKTVLTSAKNDSKDDNKNDEDDFDENYDEDDVNAKEDSYDEYDDYDSENPEQTDIGVNRTTNSDAFSKTETFKPRLNLFRNPRPYPLQNKEIENVERNDTQILTENLNLLPDNNTISQSHSINLISTESKNRSGIESDNNLIEEINFKTVEHDNNTTPESRSFINFTRRFQKRPAALNISEVQNTTAEQSTIKNVNGRRVRVFKLRKPAANLLTNDTSENSEITISNPVTANPAANNSTRRKIIRKKPAIITTSERSINKTDTITSTTPTIATATTRKTIRKVIRKLRPLSERNSTINAKANTNLTNIPIDETTGLSTGNIISTDLNIGILSSENDTQDLDFLNKTEINEEFENNENATDVQDFDSVSDSPNTTKSKLFVSRRPYRPTKPSVQALTSTESTASTARNYVRKYSSTFILPKPPAELGEAINQETGGVFVRPPNVNRFKTPPKTGISGISIKEDADVYDEDEDGEDYDDDDDDEDEDDDDDIEDDNDTNEGPNIEVENKKLVPEVILNKPNYFLLNRNKQTDETANVDRLENTHREQNANINQTKIFSPPLAPNFNSRPYLNINRATVPTFEGQSTVNATSTTANGFFNINSNIDNKHEDQDEKDKIPISLPNEQLKKPNSPIFGRRPNQPSYKPPRPTNKPRLANSPILTTVRPSSQRVGVTKTSLNTTPSNFKVTNTRSYERKYSTSSTETVPQENVLLEDLNIDALNARNKKIFQINSKKHTTVRPKTTLSDATIANTTETTLNTDLHEEHNKTFDENNHNIDTFQENVLESALPQTTTAGPFDYTTPSKMTTLQHIFSLDDYGSTVMPNDQEERVTKEKSEKLVEISRTVEIYSKQHKHTIKANGNETRTYKSTDLKLEQLPTVDKLGEINRKTLIKLVESGRSIQETGRSSNSHDVLVDGETTPIIDYPPTEPIPESPFVRNSIPEVDAESGQKQGRKLLLPELIFSVETSTIPLEGLFETSRQSKNIKPSFGPVYASSLGEVYTSQLIDDRFDTTTESATKPPEVEVEETKTEKPVNYVRPLVPLLRPESNESSPLVISIANLDKVILSKVPKQDVASSGRIDVFVEAPQTNSPVDVAINTSSTNNNKHTENTFVETLTSYSSEINHVRKKIPRKPKSSQPVESSAELL